MRGGGSGRRTRARGKNGEQKANIRGDKKPNLQRGASPSRLTLAVGTPVLGTIPREALLAFGLRCGHAREQKNHKQQRDTIARNSSTERNSQEENYRRGAVIPDLSRLSAAVE